MSASSDANKQNINVLSAFMDSILNAIKTFNPNQSFQARLYKLSAKGSDQFDFKVHSNHFSQDLTEEICKKCQTYLRISQVELKNNIYLIKINRCATFNTVLSAVSNAKEDYGKKGYNGKNVRVFPVCKENRGDFNFLRSYLIAIVVERLLTLSGYKVYFGVKKKFSEHVQVIAENFIENENIDDVRKEFISKIKTSRYTVEEDKCFRLNAKEYFEEMVDRDNSDLELLDYQINHIPLIENGTSTSVLEETIKLFNIKSNFDEPQILQVTPQNLLYFTNQINMTKKILSCDGVKKSQIVHGHVKVMNDGKETDDVSSYFKKSLEACRIEAQHKYGDDVNLPSWDVTLKALSDACIKFDFLTTKFSAPLKVDMHSSKSSGPKGKFVMYNYARISMILSKFHRLVDEGYYPQLPLIDETDFSLLDHQLDWKLLFDYIIFFPHLLQEVLNTENLAALPIHKISHFLLSMSEDVSSYYSKIHLLTEPLDHLLPTMYARLHLMIATKQVMANALYVMNITVIQQM